MHYESDEGGVFICEKDDCCTSRLRNYLKSKGGRLTRERLMLMNVICEYGAHFTPEDLQRSLAEEGHSVALTTIYRNLPALESAGIIRRTTFREEQDRGAVTYEHVWGRPHHDHLLCQACGQRVEFHYGAIEVLQEEVARQHGFKLIAHHLELVGFCPDCQGSDFAATALPAHAAEPVS